MSAPTPQTARWTKDNLTADDYRFAISDGESKWDCAASKLAGCVAGRAVAIDMYLWELWREVIDSQSFSNGATIGHYDAHPFLVLPENRQRAEAALKNPHAPRKTTALKDLAPLDEIPVENAASFKVAVFNAGSEPASTLRPKPFFQQLSVHAFYIHRAEANEQVVKRFRKWLGKYRRKHKQPAWMTISDKSDPRFKQGNIHIDRLLMALSVHRFKQAGYTRAEAEKRLKLKPRFLTTYDSAISKIEPGKTAFWSRMPALIEREIDKLVETDGLGFGGAPPFKFIAEKILP
jgi:hypothetical protein